METKATLIGSTVFNGQPLLILYVWLEHFTGHHARMRTFWEEMKL